ncbi:MAG: ParA family protein [Snowella sp.]|nr:ParA family protein [Snowella sp.]
MEKKLIAVTGDKGGVGKSSITCLFAEWLNFHDISVHIIDADPNQSTQTWVDKCREAGRNVSQPNGGKGSEAATKCHLKTRKLTSKRF